MATKERKEHVSIVSNECSVRSDSDDHLTGCESMGENKSVYIMFRNSAPCAIDQVFDSMGTVRQHLERVRDAFDDFLRSDKASVTITESVLDGEELLLEEDATCYCVGCNVPEYYPIVCSAEIEGSEVMRLSEIQDVWVSWFEDEPFYDTVYLTEEAVKKHFRSQGWLNEEDDIKDNLTVHYEKFNVIKASQVKSN